MSFTTAIAQHITEAYEGNNWSDVSVASVLEDISPEEATTGTEASPNTIAMLLYHMAFFNNAICERLKGGEPVIGDANGFDMPEIHTEIEWQQLVSNAFLSAKNLAIAIAAFPEEQLFDSKPAGRDTYYKKLHGVIEHNYYHLGQIQILKGLIKHRR